jgi:hypothetical protein
MALVESFVDVALMYILVLGLALLALSIVVPRL